MRCSFFTATMNKPQAFWRAFHCNMVSGKIICSGLDLAISHSMAVQGYSLSGLGKRELICLLLFTCNYVVSVGEVSSSSVCLGWATLFYCGTP